MRESGLPKDIQVQEDTWEGPGAGGCQGPEEGLGLRVEGYWFWEPRPRAGWSDPVQGGHLRAVGLELLACSHYASVFTCKMASTMTTL